MPSDLSYFYEKDMDCSMTTFYNKLPKHLQTKFKAAIYGNVDGNNTLQGYRGPSHFCNNGSGDSGVLESSNGLQEIKFWHAITKHYNWVPIAGPISFVIARGVQKGLGALEWCSLYFDSKTGECLSHDKNDAAEKLSAIGCRLFEEGRYSEASEYHWNAYRNCSKGYCNEQHFMSNATKADSEVKATSLNSQGDELFKQGKYAEARDKYKEAYDKSFVSSRYQIYKANREKAQAEIDAVNLNSQGNDFFRQSRFFDALCKYKEALGKSKVSAHIQIYKTNVDIAQTEVNAINWNNEGDNLFNQGRFQDALRYYQAAHDNSKVTAQIQKFKANADKTQGEIQAIISNNEGDNLFNQGRFQDALRKYQEAYDNSKVTAQIRKFKANYDKAQAEIEAINLKSEADKLFGEGRYNDALCKYQEAHKKSKFTARIAIYEANYWKAQAEIDAIHLNSEADKLFGVDRYNDALCKYQEAYNNSKVTAQIRKFKANADKAQDIINRLNMVETLWEQAWDAENDTKLDRSGEANQLLQRILSESEKNLKTIPGISKFKQYQTLAVLKIEGNEVFNEGLVSQQNGTSLFQEAQKLNQQETYKSALEKFEQAKECFQKALDKFETGSRSDQRFVPCVEFVQQQINEVHRAIELTKERILSAGFQKLDIDISSNNHSGFHTCETDATEKQKNYSQHI